VVIRPGLFQRAIRKVLRAKKKHVSWQDLEHFDEDWKGRIRTMAQYIGRQESVVDLGCGQMWLKEFLNGHVYYPVDYRMRGDDTHVADFNKHKFPDIRADTAFVSGTLEYLTDCEWFVDQISRRVKKCILSYCLVEYHPDVEERKKRAWQNHLTRAEIIAMFQKAGMTLMEENTSIVKNHIFVFCRVGS